MKLIKKYIKIIIVNRQNIVRLFQILNYLFIVKRGDKLKRKNLIKFRIDLGLKSKEVAEKLDITKTRYSNIENGKAEPSIELLYKFQDVFDVDDILELMKKED